MGDSGGVLNSLDFCPASLKSLGAIHYYLLLVLEAVTCCISLDESTDDGHVFEVMASLITTKALVKAQDEESRDLAFVILKNNIWGKLFTTLISQ